MQYIIVRTYSNGKWMNKVYPMWFEWLSQAERACEILNKEDIDGTAEKWIPVPVTKFKGSTW
jgi:hypothetical protein